jgi:hypothetical protein
MQFGKNPIMHAAEDGRRDLVEILFPNTKPIASVSNWSVDGIISTMKHLPSIAKVYIFQQVSSFSACNLYFWSLMIVSYF